MWTALPSSTQPKVCNHLMWACLNPYVSTFNLCLKDSDDRCLFSVLMNWCSIVWETIICMTFHSVFSMCPVPHCLPCVGQPCMVLCQGGVSSTRLVSVSSALHDRAGSDLAPALHTYHAAS